MFGQGIIPKTGRVMGRSRTFRSSAVFAMAGLLGVCMAATAPVRAAQEVVLVNFTSEYCSVCKVLDPRLDQAMAGYDPARVARLELDFTSAETSQAAYDRVNGSLLANPYADYLGITGIGVLVAADSGETIECLVAAMSPEVMRTYMDMAVEMVRTRPVGGRSDGAVMCPSTNKGVRID